MMLFDRHHLHIFGNREIKSLYLTLGLLYFAEGLISVFVPIYFLELGFSLAKIILFYLLVSLYFVSITAISIRWLKHLSDKMMMFLSLPFLILYFIGLGTIGSFPFLFWLLPLATAASMLLFNVGYHLDFTGASDEKDVGKEVGTRSSIGALVQFAAPFTGGVLITTLGFQPTFVIGSLLLVLAVLPLFFFKKRSLSPRITTHAVAGFLKSRKFMPFTLSGIGYAAEIMIGRLIWPIFIFLTIGSIEQLGGIVSIGVLAGAVITFLAGFLSDVGRRRKTLTASTGVLAGVWATRPFMHSIGTITTSHILGNMTTAALMVAWSSQYYKIAKSLKDPSVFILSREVLYHLARIAFLPLLMAAAHFLPQQTFFPAAFAATAAISLLFLAANKLHVHTLREHRH